MGFCGLSFFLTPESERLNLSFLVDAAQSLSALFLILSFSPPLHSSRHASDLSVDPNTMAFFFFPPAFSSSWQFLRLQLACP